MDDELFQKMDSLWLFSSVLRPCSHLPTKNSEIGMTRSEFTYAEKQNREVQEQSPAKEPSQIDLKVKESYNCSEKGSSEKKKRKRKGRNSRNRVQKWIQLSSPPVMELEERTPFAVIYDSQLKNSSSNEGVGVKSQFRQLTMPQVSDDLAMKAQLRSWAYAVACSVR